MYRKENRKKPFPILILLSFLLLFSGNSLSADIRGLWVMAWDLTTPEEIDNMLRFAEEYNINQIFAHIRYRADALYTRNRIFDEFYNPEFRSYILEDDSFDPLAYLIEVTAGTDMEVHAWVTVFVTTPRTIENLSFEHLFHTKNNWITKDFLGNPMAYHTYEGAYIDPGIPEVHDYLIDVFLDIITNYPVQGIQLDYIRYPDSQFGYNPAALENYKQSGYDTLNFHQWKQSQIDRFVRRFYAEMKYHNPELIVSAAVISNLERARKRYSQNWTNWLDEGWLDYVYLMSYSTSDDVILRELMAVEKWKERIIVGLRAWNDDIVPYPPDLVSNKISISKRIGFPGIALFSYSGVKTNNNPRLKRSLAGRKSQAAAFANNFVFGYVTDHNDNRLSKIPVYLNGGMKIEYTDENGFFFFNNLEPGDYWLKSEKGINVVFSSNFSIPASRVSQSQRYNLVFPDLNETD